MGPDAFCSEAKDLNACLALGNACRPAYEDSADESVDPVFSVCIANPDYTSGTDDGSGESGSGGDGSVTAGSDDGSATAGSTDGSATAGSDGGSSTAGSTDGSVSGGSSGGVDNDVPPTLEEALASKCSNLDERYLWIKKIVDKDRTQVIKKVKVCHMTGSGSSHTIIIACPALKAHVPHEDTLGVCKE